MDRIYDALGEIGFDHHKSTLTIKQRSILFNRIEGRENDHSVTLSSGIGVDLLIK